ncbi:recombinase family protein [Frondihabitans peucedani]
MIPTSITGCGVLERPRSGFHGALEAIRDGDTLVVTSLERLGRLTQNMLEFAGETVAAVGGAAGVELWGRGCGYDEPRRVDGLQGDLSLGADGAPHQEGANG